MYHREYPIRCKSSNDQLACYSEEYERLVEEFSIEFGTEFAIEKALNKLGIMEPCCRDNMMNPTMILNIKENRSLIEGIKDIDVLDKFSSNYSFKQCTRNIRNADYNAKIQNPEPKEKDVQQKKTTVFEVVQENDKSKKSSSKSNLINRQLISKEISKGSLSKNIPEPDSGNETQIIINEPEKVIEFKYPTVVGIPTINQSGENTKIHVSGTYYADVLSGRTYLAR